MAGVNHGRVPVYTALKRRQLIVHNNGHVNDETGTANCGNHSFLHVWTITRETARPAQQGSRSRYQATVESLGHKDHGDLPLRNDRDDDDHDEL